MARAPLTSFGVKNFKAFSSLQEVPVRPITLLFGRNNCGKSALLRSLVHGAEMMRVFDRDTEGTRDNDAYSQKALTRVGADIGRYPDYLHHRDPKLVSFTYSIAPSPRTPLSDTALGAVSDIGIRCEFAFDDSVDDSDGVPADELLRTSGALVGDGRPLIRDGILDCAHPLVVRLLDWAISQSGSNVPSPSLRQDVIHFLADERFGWSDVPAFPPELTYLQFVERKDDASGALGAEWGRLAEEQPRAHLSQRAGRELAWEEIQEISAVANRVGTRVVRLLDELARALRPIMERQIYIGPLRGVPESVWALSGPETQGMPFWRILAESSEARDAVNDQLAKLVGGDDPVRVHVEQFGSSIPLSEAQVHRLAASLLPQAESLLRETLEATMESDTSTHGDLGGIEPEDLAEQWARELVRTSASRVKAEVRLEVGRHPRLLPASQVGLGLSQMIPVVAAAMLTDDRLLLVEQPELHLHPAMQAELGDLFIESALGANQNTWIIETHSEHLLLRLMRRIRETTHGRLPEGVRGLTPQDVSVCFIEKDQGVSRVFPIPLDENGMITRPWPGGFFEEGFREVMAW